MLLFIRVYTLRSIIQCKTINTNEIEVYTVLGGQIKKKYDLCYIEPGDIGGNINLEKNGQNEKKIF